MSRSLNTVSRVASNAQRNVQGQAHERNVTRGFHGSLRQQAILMPAMSPLVNEGTITRWMKREGEAFAAGDVLLQIESDIATIDVEAHSPGILGRILLPDGTTNVPVEQAIALVARNAQELAALQSFNIPVTSSYNPIPSPPSARSSPTPHKSVRRLRPPPITTPRKLSLYELHTMGRSPEALASTRMVSSSAMGGTLTPGLRSTDHTGPLSTGSGPYPKTERSVDYGELDGATIRRKIVANLTGINPRFRTDTLKA